MLKTMKNKRRAPEPDSAATPLRFVTATSLFDGHDAAINIMRRIMQQQGAEVIHLGHNRSVQEIVTAAIQEDADAIAVSSYQGGHIEFFSYMIELLEAEGAGHIKVFGGGGGVIVAEEIRQLHERGVARIYSPADGQSMGLKGMISDMMERAGQGRSLEMPAPLPDFTALSQGELARLISGIESGLIGDEVMKAIGAVAADHGVPVLGITGTGGAGKSSLTDELIRRFRFHSDEPKIAVLAIDPSKRKTGGALLGDRIRMNAIGAPNVFFRSLATRSSVGEVPAAVPQIIDLFAASNVDLIIVETPGIGQGDAGIVPFSDISLYVMTPEFGAASQLEKIDMLDFADVVAINKFDRKGAEDALRDVSKQYQRNHEAFDVPVDEMPVFGAIAARFADEGVSALYLKLIELLGARGFAGWSSDLAHPGRRASAPGAAIIPPSRSAYLAGVASCVRDYHRTVAEQVELARERQHLMEALRLIGGEGGEAAALTAALEKRERMMDPRARRLLEIWPDVKQSYDGDEYVVKIRDQEKRIALTYETLSGTRIPKVSLPSYADEGEILKWLLKENVPGSFPFTAGVFAFKREGEDPTRMFAGEGGPKRTNRRFKLLSEGMPAKRLSTAFDSVTLYGQDPDERPDIYGKVGNSGVSIATLDDMKDLYDGFDLIHPATSVSMTINGPAPAILAMYLNTAIDQQLDKFRDDNDRAPTEDEVQKIRAWVLNTVRGTVQADILKEDQGQNTCLFSTEFSLRMMADIQEYFVRNQVQNFYSVSISGYHIAEAGANPISQLAFTLANGFTYVEAYLARGMHIDEFAPNLSFFFSNGMDAEYTVMGRVARRIWSTAMRFRYGANERSQKLKYHTQTSGRSLHAQEMAFNDIRTTLQALIATYDNTNSLHTNAYDEAITTPTGESVRRAMAIQLIINREWGLAKNENPNQGAFIIDELTDLVEEAVLKEFERMSERGGVLGAMETGYQRGKIQDESMLYEHRKHDGSYPIVGVNTFLNPDEEAEAPTPELARSTDAEKQDQLARLRRFQSAHGAEAEAALARLKQVAAEGGNTFDVLMEAVRSCSLGQISGALFEAGGQYRRNV